MTPQRVVSARSALWIASFIALTGLMYGTLRGQDEETDVPEDARERLVLFKSGRMLTGKISRNAGGYLIEQANGRIQVPQEEIKFVVGDLHEAYQKQRDSIVEPTPATHVALANWCITYQLYDDAREELKRCLKTNPDSNEARRLLHRLTDTLKAGQPQRVEMPARRKTIEGFQQPEAESLGGLSKETAIQFVSRIQPLLINKCGNASCHGVNSKNQFHISSSRVGARNARQTSEQNLAETLRYIDTDDLTKSRLLSVLQGSHGGKGTIFVGQAASGQIKTIRTWARVVAQEKQSELQELEQHANAIKKPRSNRRVVQASATYETRSSGSPSKTDLNDVSDEEPAEPEDDTSRPNELKVDPTDAVELAREPTDAFDPEQFNQRSSATKPVRAKE